MNNPTTMKKIRHSPAQPLPPVCNLGFSGQWFSGQLHVCVQPRSVSYPANLAILLLRITFGQHHVGQLCSLGGCSRAGGDSRVRRGQLGQRGGHWGRSRPAGGRPAAREDGNLHLRVRDAAGGQLEVPQQPAGFPSLPPLQQRAEGDQVRCGRRSARWPGRAQTSGGPRSAGAGSSIQPRAPTPAEWPAKPCGGQRSTRSSHRWSRRWGWRSRAASCG